MKIYGSNEIIGNLRFTYGKNVSLSFLVCTALCENAQELFQSMLCFE